MHSQIIVTSVLHQLFQEKFQPASKQSPTCPQACKIPKGKKQLSRPSFAQTTAPAIEHLPLQKSVYTNPANRCYTSMPVDVQKFTEVSCRVQCSSSVWFVSSTSINGIQQRVVDRAKGLAPLPCKTNSESTALFLNLGLTGNAHVLCQMTCECST